jgi:hypothetical protein
MLKKKEERGKRKWEVKGENKCKIGTKKKRA